MNHDPRALVRIFGWLLLALILGALAVVVDGQEPPHQTAEQFLASLPSAPDPSRAQPLDWTLLTLDASARALDTYSTTRMLNRGHRELFLPVGIAGNPAAMAAYSAGVVGAVWLTSRELRRHGHRRLAQLVVATDAAQDGWWAVQNLFLSSPQPKRTLFVPRGIRQ